MIVAAVGQIGCIPYQLARYNGSGSGSGSRCNEEINNAIVLFNTGLKQLVDRANRGQLPGARFVYLDSYFSSQELVQKARTYGMLHIFNTIILIYHRKTRNKIDEIWSWTVGFEVVDKGCCGVGKNNGQITCLPLQTPCDNRQKYVFWDAFHPTEAANILLANKAYSSKSKSFSYPTNIQQLAAL